MEVFKRFEREVPEWFLDAKFFWFRGALFQYLLGAKLFAYADAQYIVPLSKHHDGITLWDAPGTGTRNTVLRGPKRDLIGDIATVVRKAGIRFAVYYSGGIDWEVTKTLPAISDNNQSGNGLLRPVDAAYSMYAYEHVIDLIDRYKPDVLWNDINWPDFAKREGAYSLAALFDHYYKVVPHGIVNDRWGKETHFDIELSH